MQTQAATAASSCMIYVPFSVSPHAPWSPREQLAEIFDWLSGGFHKLCFTSFYSCSNDLVSLWVTWLLRQCPDTNEAVAAISGNCHICSEQETCNNIDGVTTWRVIVKSNMGNVKVVRFIGSVSSKKKKSIKASSPPIQHDQTKVKTWN